MRVFPLLFQSGLSCFPSAESSPLAAKSAGRIATRYALFLYSCCLFVCCVRGTAREQSDANRSIGSKLLSEGHQVRTKGYTIRHNLFSRFGFIAISIELCIKGERGGRGWLVLCTVPYLPRDALRRSYGRGGLGYQI